MPLLSGLTEYFLSGVIQNTTAWSNPFNTSLVRHVIVAPEVVIALTVISDTVIAGVGDVDDGDTTIG